MATPSIQTYFHSIGKRCWHSKICRFFLATCGIVSLIWLILICIPPLPLLEGVPFSRIILDRNEHLLRLGLSADEKYRLRVTLDEINPEAVSALLLYEDRHFYAHPGVNLFSLLRATKDLLFKGKRRMGGSTITMQVVRLRHQLHTSTWRGKLWQIALALHAERHYSKQQLLEAYFNLAPYGGNIEGIAAAAHIYFKKTPQQISLAESLALIPIPQNPPHRSPLKGSSFDSARLRLYQMWRAIHPDALLPTATDTSTLPRLRVFTPAQLPFEAPHISSALLKAPLHKERIITTIQRDMQHLLESILSHFTARRHMYDVHNAAALLLHNPTMEIHALAGSANFHDASLQGQIDGTLARRSPGSTLKPFIYALALDQGLIHPHSLMLDSPRSFAGYDPENFDKNFRGPLSATEALKSSRNLPAIELASKLQAPNLYEFLAQSAIRLPHDENYYGLALVLGGAEINMREMAQLYAMLANQGLFRTATLLRDTPLPSPQRMLSPEGSYITLNMLQEQGSSASLPYYLKTGTSNGFRDAWAAGILGQYTVIVWLGNFNNKPNPLFVGGELAVPLWKELASALQYSFPLQDTIQKQRSDLNIREIAVCRATGDTDTSLCTQQTTSLFIPGISPIRNTGIFQKIHIDKATGQRACIADAEKTREEVWEFWPSEMRQLFLRAGIYKALPPPFLPQCKEQGSHHIAVGKAPRILQPKKDVRYHIRFSDSTRNNIPLAASLDADATHVYWFADDRFIGQSTPEEQLLWTPQAGVVTLRAVDNLGRATHQKVVIESLP